ncbi:MAG: hypothetical protein U1D55_07060 [Phycisphaerae bacterium]
MRSSLTLLATLLVAGIAVGADRDPARRIQLMPDTIDTYSDSYDPTQSPVLRGPGTVVYENFPFAVGVPTDPNFATNLFRLGDNPNRVAETITMSCIGGNASPATPVVLSQIDLGTRTVIANPTGPISFDILVSFYDDYDLTSATAVFTNQIGSTVRFSVTNYNAIRHYASINLAGANIVLNDPVVGVEILYVNPGGNSTANFPAQCSLGTCATTPCKPAGDRGPTGLFFTVEPTVNEGDDRCWAELTCGFAAPCNVADNVWTNCDDFVFVDANNVAVPTHLAMRLWASTVPALPPAIPPAAVCLGSLIDDDAAPTPGPLVISNSLAAGQVRWYQFTLTENLDPSAAGGAGEYLDILTDGSNIPDADPPPTGAVPNDTYLALYDSTGVLVAENDDAPGQTTVTYFMSALSFGDDLIPRPIGTSGLLVIGDNGRLPKGHYYLAASGFPVNRLTCVWGYSSTSVDTGTLRLSLSANLVNPCPGDLDGNKVVNESDLGVLLSHWQADACGDLNRDGQTNEPDLGILLANWQVTCGPN